MFNCGPRRMNKWSNDLRKVRVDGFNRLLVSSMERGVPTPGMDQLIGRVKREEKLRVLGGNTYSHSRYHFLSCPLLLLMRGEWTTVVSEFRTRNRHAWSMSFLLEVCLSVERSGVLLVVSGRDCHCSLLLVTGWRVSNSRQGCLRSSLFSKATSSNPVPSTLNSA